MWIKASDVLSETVIQLTTVASSNFLIIGDAAALVDAGVSATSRRLIEELETYLGENGEPDFVLLTHAHFDHVGGIPALRQRYPQLEVFAAPQTAQLLGDKEILKSFYEKNKACAEAMQEEFDYSEEDWCTALKVDRIFGDGDVLDLGADVEVKLISTPGHTEDSVAYFVRPDDALICGETIGSYRGRDQVTGCFTDNFEAYLASLDKLSSLDVKILGFPHNGAITGEMVGKYFIQAREQAEKFRQDIKERIEQGELVEEIVNSLLPEWQAQNIAPEGPFVEEQEATLKAMIRAAASS